MAFLFTAFNKALPQKVTIITLGREEYGSIRGRSTVSMYDWILDTTNKVPKVRYIQYLCIIGY